MRTRRFKLGRSPQNFAGRLRGIPWTRARVLARALSLGAAGLTPLVNGTHHQGGRVSTPTPGGILSAREQGSGVYGSDGDSFQKGRPRKPLGRGASSTHLHGILEVKRVVGVARRHKLVAAISQGHMILQQPVVCIMWTAGERVEWRPSMAPCPTARARASIGSCSRGPQYDLYIKKHLGLRARGLKRLQP